MNLDPISEFRENWCINSEVGESGKQAKLLKL